MYRSNLYPKVISTFIEEIQQKVSAEVFVKYTSYKDDSGNQYKVITSIETSGVVKVEKIPIVTSLLDHISRVDARSSVILDKGFMITGAILNQEEPENPRLLLNFAVECGEMENWTIDEFQSLNSL